MYNYPFMRPSLLSRGLDLAKGMTFSSFLDGTQKTLGVINQTIPIINQLSPVVKNAKTIFKIAGAINSPSSNTRGSKTYRNNSVNETKNTSHNNSSPIFYI